MARKKLSPLSRWTRRFAPKARNRTKTGLMTFTKSEMKKWSPDKRSRMYGLATYEKVYTDKTWRFFSELEREK